MAAQAADWAPIRHRDTLHDRASYRYFWQVLQRAHRTAFRGPQLPARRRRLVCVPTGGAADLNPAEPALHGRVWLWFPWQAAQFAP